MKDGYWINWQTGKVLEMPAGGDHEVFIRQVENAKSLSVPDSVFQQFTRFKIGEAFDRHKFLVWLFKAVRLIRVRGHGNWTSFNFSARCNDKPYKAIQRCAAKWFGPVMLMEVVNFHGAKPRGMRVFPHQFDAVVKKQERRMRTRKDRHGGSRKGCSI